LPPCSITWQWTVSL